MINDNDIPAPWWIRFILVRVVRYLRNTSWGRYIVFLVKNRSHLGFLAKLHQKAIHDIRRLAVAQLNGCSEDFIMATFQNIANSFRDIMADIIEIPPAELHCTIKIFAETEEDDPAKYEVYTLVRSEDSENYWHGRPLEYGTKCCHIVGENSSFAAILGVSDRKNDWSAAYTCFIANDLDKCEKYDSSGVDWKYHYKSTAIFPIRYQHPNEQHPHVIGFVTFDAKTSVFGRDSIFNQQTPFEYHKKVNALSLFHVGGILADSIYPSLINYRAQS